VRGNSASVWGVGGGQWTRGRGAQAGGRRTDVSARGVILGGGGVSSVDNARARELGAGVCVWRRGGYCVLPVMGQDEGDGAMGAHEVDLRCLSSYQHKHWQTALLLECAYLLSDCFLPHQQRR
jgi:hypothetical protein